VQVSSVYVQQQDALLATGNVQAVGGADCLVFGLRFRS
jgi:hypothetical protein